MSGSNDETADDVLLVYGHVMAVVQQWELALAIIWLKAGRKHPNRPTGDFDSARSQKELRRLEDALLRKTAGQVYRQVGPHLEPDTADELTELVAARNRLAHRYLREQAFGHQSSFAPGTRRELLTLGARFMSSLTSMRRTIAGLSHEYTGPILDGWEARAERITSRVFTGEQIPVDPQDQ